MHSIVYLIVHKNLVRLIASFCFIRRRPTIHFRYVKEIRIEKYSATMAMYLIKVFGFSISCSTYDLRLFIIIIIELFTISNSIACIPDYYWLLWLLLLPLFHFFFTFASNKFDFDAKNIEFHYFYMHLCDLFNVENQFKTV